MATRSFQIGKYTISSTDLHPRDGIRWAVGARDGRRSSTWRLWGDKKGDACLAMRSLGSQLKVSVHRDRRCNVGFTKEYEGTARERFGATSRHWARWTLPEGSVVRAFQVVVPDSDLAEFSSEEAEPMVWIPAPGEGRAVVFSLFVAEPPQAFNWEDPEHSGQLIGTMIAKSRFTWLVHKSQDINAETRQFIEHNRHKALEMAAGSVRKEDRLNARLALWGHRETNDFFFIELDAKKEPEPT